MTIKDVFKDNKKIKIHVLTPLYIGDGNEFDVTKFWIDTDKKEIVEFRQDDFIEKLSSEQKKQIFENCSNATEESLKKIMKLSLEIKPNGIRKKVSYDIISKYNSIINGRPEFNQFAIKKTATDINKNIPYIPGSSIKGTLRTGFLNLFENVHYSTNKKIEKIEEDKYLGKMNESLFASIKVSDFISSKVNTTIYNIDRVSKKKDRRNEYKHLAVSMVETINPGSVFEGTMSILSYVETKIKCNDIMEILKATDSYFRTILKDDKIGIVYPKISQIDEIQKNFNNETYLCRLGGMTGAESHTIEPRNIKIIEGRGKSPSYRENTTRLLYVTPDKKKTDDNNIGLGWCIIEILENEDKKENLALKKFISEQEKILNKIQNYNQNSHRYQQQHKNEKMTFANVARIIKSK